MSATDTPTELAGLAEIPGPKQRPIIGALPELLSDERQVKVMENLAKEHGPIFKVGLGGREMVVVNSHEYVDQICSDPRFRKVIHSVLQPIRAFAGDGLFTAYNSEPNWAKAHRLLMPAFGPMAIRDYFPQMVDIADQMFTRWERFGDDHVIDVSNDMTRLTLDTIALCAFDYRFNSFYADDLHPFVGAMVRSLVEAGDRARRLPQIQPLLVHKTRRWDADIRYMKKITREIVAARKQMPAGEAPNDLLQRMLTAVDPLTGQKLSAENVEYQLVTFLIAGHETTSGLLSFVTYQLLANRQVLAKARSLVDDVLGDRMPRFEDLAELGYLNQILRETLRLHPTAPAFGLKPSEEVVLSDRYRIEKGQTVMVILPNLHRDPEVWQEPDRFDPDRFAPGRLEQIPEHAWKPFGHGERACIGRPFALQEATLVLAMMLQRFDFEFTGPYEYDFKETLTIKPADLKITARQRKEIDRSTLATATSGPAAATASGNADGTPLLVLYGSNTGSAEGFARTVAGDATDRGWRATVAPLDEYTNHLPVDGAVLIVTASYNGTPPDNAAQFVEWVEGLEPGALDGVKYAVMGVGSRDWAATYQRIPTLIDQKMADAGAERLRDRGEADGQSDFFGDWERWYRDFWPDLEERLKVTSSQVAEGPAYAVTASEEASLNPIAVKLRMQPATVLVNRELVNMRDAHGRSKRHLEIALPDGVSYRTGDYLSVLPRNHPALIARACRAVGVDPQSHVTLGSRRDASNTAFPLDRPIRVAELLGEYVDLTLPATRGTLKKLAAKCPCPPEREQIQELIEDDAKYTDEVLAKHVGVVDLLEMFPSCGVDLPLLLDLLRPMRARQYSISSSAMEQPDVAALTIAVLEAPARSGLGTYHGTGSSFMQTLQPGSSVPASISSPHENFRLPEDNQTPLILIGAGSGMAPLRGFIRERAVRARGGETAGETLLFFGCDHPDVDDLYAEEYVELAGDANLTTHKAYTFAPDGEIMFVQHRLWAERDAVARLLADGAKVMVCGDGERMAPAVHETLARIHAESAGGSLEESLAWLEQQRESGGYATDVFS
ncbi:bifunctional cytochrome P450/NADPH--P450 reductase [Blastococcus sp. Marseille-P5729]|uniref:bifunctional cytochrome P450/NADPH--P450 reductase n=1 Tax=Blastococcus sp. Marseille-P5729 TaxID=2086582 RepID=UPI000D10CE25|nr:cytochrome P450 [Blastococcus sp. Marseille-P5729]